MSTSSTTRRHEAGIQPVILPQEGLEAAERKNENGRFLFLLNHGNRELEVKVREGGKDLISGEAYSPGGRIFLEAKGVRILKIEEKI